MFDSQLHKKQTNKKRVLKKAKTNKTLETEKVKVVHLISETTEDLKMGLCTFGNYGKTPIVKTSMCTDILHPRSCSLKYYEARKHLKAILLCKNKQESWAINPRSTTQDRDLQRVHQVEPVSSNNKGNLAKLLEVVKLNLTHINKSIAKYCPLGTSLFT